MKLSKILNSCEVEGIFGEKEVEIESIVSDSKKARKRALFVAIKGLHIDSHEKIDEVIKKGVLCVVGEKKPQEKWLKKITYVMVKDSKQALGIICSNWFNNPSKKMKMIGVTGTDGKTTTCSMIYSILNQNKKP